MVKAASILIALYWILSALVALVFVVFFLPCIWLQVKSQTRHVNTFDIVTPLQKRAEITKWLIVIISLILFITCLLIVP